MSDKDTQLYISATLNSRVSEAKGYLNGPPSEEGETLDAHKKLQSFHRTLTLHTQDSGEINQANHTCNEKKEEEFWCYSRGCLLYISSVQAPHLTSAG